MEAYVHVRRPSESPEEHAKRKNYLYSMIYDALGWSLSYQNRSDEAVEAFKTALDLDSRNRMAWYHYGVTMENVGDLGTAESLYIRSLSIPALGETPAETALQAVYKAKNGSLEGYRDYRVALARSHSDRRREEILGDRLEPRKNAPPFSLATIQGDTVSLARTRGKVVVINFWGIWCSWCIRELPEYQLLYEKYDEDENVLILSINNDKDSQDVTDWLRDRGFTFTTLLDDGYVRSSKVRSFPTTWFLDREGRIVYLQKGYTPNLLEEFSWRIDSLKVAPRP